MIISLHHLSAKSLHIAYWLANFLLSAMLSWAAIDHLIRPKDLADNVRRLGFSALTVLKSVIGSVPVAVRAYASFSSWLRRPAAADSQPYLSKPLQTI